MALAFYRNGGLSTKSEHFQSKHTMKKNKRMKMKWNNNGINNKCRVTCTSC